MTTLFSNNAVSTLAIAAEAGATSITLTSGDGSRFPTLGGGDRCYIRLGTDDAFEIATVTARAGDVLTVAALTGAWAINTDVILPMTAEALVQMRSEILTAAAAGIPANAGDLAVTPTGGLTSTDVQAALEELQTELASAGAVASVHGRTGAVTSVSGDYNAGQVAVSPVGDLVATNVQAALEELQTELTALDLTTIQTHTQTVGDGTATVFAISHGFGSYDVLVNVRTSVAPFTKLEESAYDVVYTDTDNLQLTFTTAPTAGQYEVFCATFTAGGEVGGAPLPGTQIYDAPGVYSFVVPGGVTEMTAKVWGAGGGGASTGAGGTGGGGGFAQALLAVTPGEVLTVRVGAGGLVGIVNSRMGGGGGISGAFRGADLMTSVPLVVAGAGGGAARANNNNYSSAGGAGGGTAGSAGTLEGSAVATGGGTQVSGGTGSTSGGYLTGATLGSLLFGSAYHSASGGAGYYGGGASPSTAQAAVGGGGGSGYTPTSGSPLLAVGAPTPTNTAGSGVSPANTGDPDYGLSSAGLGAAAGSSGNPGRVVLTWS